MTGQPGESAGVILGRSRRQRLERMLLRARLGAVVRGRAAVHTWRASLQIRVITSTLVVGIAAVAVLGGYLSSRIRDGLVDERVNQLLEESARAAEQAQASFDAADVSTGDQVTLMFNSLVPTLKVGGSGEREVFLRSTPRDAPLLGVNDVSTSPRLVGLITPALRDAVRNSDEQQWMSVGIPPDSLATAGSGTVASVVTAGATSPPARVDPGIVIGSTVQVPTAGQYELYFVYNLAPEQATLSFVQRALALAAIGLVVLLGAMTWLVTRQAVNPVRSAARVAERLADGHLTERMTVKGVDEMATLARSFNEMAESLQDQIRRMEELSHLQRRFVSDVSHELRTPLTTVRMAAEVIHAARNELDPAASRSAELLTTQLDRFEELLADLLEISRFDAGAAMLDAERRDVRDVVTGAVVQAAPLADRRGVWLTVDLPDRPTFADIDPRRVERILRNLLVNAIEHAETRPVEVRLAVDRRAVAVTVRDRGVGMTEEQAEHVFDRFWRADPARARTTGGTGLGLAISVEDAHLHGGWLEVWGRPGEGACFRLTLPKRAGIVLESSPLPLVPQEEHEEPQVSYASHEGRPALDPAALPDLDQLEVR